MLLADILKNYKSNILEANKLVATASVLSGLLELGVRCRVKYLHNDQVLNNKYRDFYPVLNRSTVFDNSTFQKARLVLLQDWIRHDASQTTNFMQCLSSFKRKEISDFVDNFYLSKIDIKAILDNSSHDLRERVLLALILFINAKNPVCESFLFSQTDASTNKSFNTAVTDQLDDYDQEMLRGELGLPQVMPVSPTATAPDKNIDTRNDFYVESMNKAMYINNSSNAENIHTKPESKAKGKEFVLSKGTCIVVGEVKKRSDNKSAGYYMIIVPNELTAGYVNKKSFAPV
jgi:hypothetical protein